MYIVCLLSRAKRVDDLLLAPTLFDRIARLGESPMLKAKLHEELSLKPLAVDTLQRCTAIDGYNRAYKE